MRVVVAEDMVLLREGVCRLLRDAGIDVVAQAGDARALVASVVEHRPDMVIADVRMPPGYTDEGARAVELLRDRYPGLAVLMLSNVIDPVLAMTFVRRGPRAFGYLLNDRVLDSDDFIAAVRRIANGGTATDPDVVNFYLSTNESRLAALTARELEVLRQLARGLSNAGIAHALNLSDRTVDAHLRSIFAKLELEQSPDGNRRIHAALAWLNAVPGP